MTIKSIMRLLKTGSQRILYYAVMFDTSPSEVLYTELCDVRRELAQLKQLQPKVDSSPHIPQ